MPTKTTQTAVLYLYRTERYSNHACHPRVAKILYVYHMETSWRTLVTFYLMRRRRWQMNREGRTSITAPFRVGTGGVRRSTHHFLFFHTASTPVDCDNPTRRPTPYLAWTRSNTAWRLDRARSSETPRERSFARKEDHDDARSGNDRHRDEIEDRPALVVALEDLVERRVRRERHRNRMRDALLR